jgi:hypothetical protein
MKNLVIRIEKSLNLILFQNIEKVFFLYKDDIMLNNSLQYDDISNHFDKIVESTKKG